MTIYLVRHGDAVETAATTQPALSTVGKAKVKRLGKLLATLKLKPAAIFHSGKLRAEQTAEILAKAIHFKGSIEARADLEPLSSVNPIASEINQAEVDVIYVGHLPFMGKLAAKLLTGNEANEVVIFQTATALCLEKVGGEAWLIRWMLVPEVVV